MTTIHVLLDLNNVNRLCAFDIPARQQAEGSLALRDYLSSTFVFSFLLKWSCGSQGWNSFLEGDVVLSSTSKF